MSPIYTHVAIPHKGMRAADMFSDGGCSLDERLGSAVYNTDSDGEHLWHVSRCVVGTLGFGELAMLHVMVWFQCQYD